MTGERRDAPKLLRCDPLNYQMPYIRALTGVLDSNSAHITIRIQIQDCVFIEILRLRDITCIKFYIQRIGVFEVLDFQGLISSVKKPTASEFGWIAK